MLRPPPVSAASRKSRPAGPARVPRASRPRPGPRPASGVSGGVRAGPGGIPPASRVGPGRVSADVRRVSAASRGRRPGRPGARPGRVRRESSASRCGLGRVPGPGDVPRVSPGLGSVRRVFGHVLPGPGQVLRRLGGVPEAGRAPAPAETFQGRARDARQARDLIKTRFLSCGTFFWCSAQLFSTGPAIHGTISATELFGSTRPSVLCLLFAH